MVILHIPVIPIILPGHLTMNFDAWTKILLIPNILTIPYILTIPSTILLN